MSGVGNAPSTSSTKPNRHPYRTRFAEISIPEANREKVLLTGREKASGVYWDHLVLNEEQKKLIGALYKPGNPNAPIIRQDYSEAEDQQNIAAAWLASFALDEDSKEALGSRWSIKWTHTWGKDGLQKRRILYQCDCGYDHMAAGRQKRRNPMPFTCCLAHVEVIYLVKNSSVLSVRGYPHHNEECQAAHLTTYPVQPVHPEVFSVALEQLKIGADLTEIQETNRRMFQTRAYKSLAGVDLLTAGYRWMLRATDTRSLYRQFNRLQGVKTSVASHVNIDNWLRADSPTHNPTIAEAVFYYSPRRTREDRIKICIATPRMLDAAWEYAHDSQIIINGTFGVSSRKLLLFIVMAVDEDWKGVPLAFLFFSAPTKNKQTSAGYDTAILTELLEQWKSAVCARRSGSAFNVHVAITDTDLKERNALLNVFPDIWLLICKFHLRQSWRNHRNRELKGTSPLAQDLKSRLQRLETLLVHTTEYATFQSLIAEHREVLARMEREMDAPGTEALHGLALIHGADAHLGYLEGFWGSEALWRSWSDFGRCVAAVRLGCTVEGVLPTTNHVESFNGVFKHKHVTRWQHYGRPLRIDMLVNVTVTKILPAIFQQRDVDRNQNLLWEQQLLQLPGGAALLAQKKASRTGGTVPPVAYISADKPREHAAEQLVSNRQISTPSVDDEGRTFSFTCYSSLATTQDTRPVMYRIDLSICRTGACTCPDFQNRGGACKHIRAALLVLGSLRERVPTIPAISLPTSEAEARRLAAGALLSTGAIPPALASLQAQIAEPPQHIQRAANAVHDVLQDGLPAGGEGEDSGEEGSSGSSSEDELPGADVISDGESVATDASGDPYTFTALMTSSRAAVGEQSTSRALHELEMVAPKLGSLAEYLDTGTIRSPADVERLQAVKESVDRLSSSLGRLLLDAPAAAAENPPERSQPATRPSTPPASSSRHKRHRTDLLDASPEKKQKRKQSYNPY